MVVWNSSLRDGHAWMHAICWYTIWPASGKTQVWIPNEKTKHL